MGIRDSYMVKIGTGKIRQIGTSKGIVIPATMLNDENFPFSIEADLFFTFIEVKGKQGIFISGFE